MAASNTDRFKKSKRKFETTVGVGGILAGGTTLPLTSVTGLDTSTAVTLVVGAGTATEEVITGVVSGSNLINCVRGKEGTTDSAHSAGETVNMFFTETHWDDAMDGILVEHDQDGTHGDINADSITATPTNTGNTTQSIVKKRAKINKLVNNLQFKITTSRVEDDYTLLTLSAKGYLVPTGDPQDWKS